MSYADFITLLFAFFTTMYAISTVDAQKMGRLVLSMQAAFQAGVFPAASTRMGISDTTTMPLPRNTAMFDSIVRDDTFTEGQSSLTKLRQSMMKKIKRADLSRIEGDLNRLIADDALKDKVRIEVKSRGVVISLAEAGFFDSGQAEVKPKSISFLNKIADYLARLPNNIRVEGHTDDVPISTYRYPSNWELSTARATFIVSYLINTHHIDPRRLSAAGYGEFHPVDSNTTPEGRAHNRRVDIVILTASAMLQEPDSVVPEAAKDLLRQQAATAPTSPDKS